LTLAESELGLVVVSRVKLKECPANDIGQLGTRHSHDVLIDFCSLPNQIVNIRKAWKRVAT
jgi:hypothetical protein